MFLPWIAEEWQKTGECWWCEDDDDDRVVHVSVWEMMRDDVISM